MTKMFKQRWFYLGCCLLMAFFTVVGAYAQTKTIKGKVVDVSNQPVIGASVQIKGTSIGTITDVNGNYAVNASPKDVLVFTFIGYTPAEQVVGNRSVVNITLAESTVQIQDVVVVGYGTQKKANLTGAVSTVDVGKSLSSKPFTDVGKGLQGAVPGLTVTYGSGGITSAPTLNVRGLVSINGNSTPLILVDGIVVSDITLVSPEDIESVSVLKDAASTSIFGARAAAGVIMIKTKSGAKNSKFKISYSNNFAWGTPTKLPSFPNDPVAEINTEVAAFARQGSGFDMFGMQAPQLIAGIQNWQAKYANNRTSNQMVKGEDFDMVNGTAYFYRIWDPKKEMYQTMPSQNHNIQFSGGSDKLSYFLSGTYSYQEGILKIHPDKLSKYNLTAGVNADINKWLNLDTKLTTRQYNYDYPYAYQDYMYYMWRWGAYFPYGTYADSNSGQNYYFRNVNGYIANANNCTFRQNTQNVNIAASIRLTQDLKFRTEFSYMTINGMRHETGGQISLWDYWSGGLVLNSTLPSATYNETDYTSSVNKQITSNSYFTYEKRLGKHGIKGMVGMNAEKGEFIQQYSKGFGLMNNSMGEIALVTNTSSPVIYVNPTTSPNYGPNHTWWSVAGYFARANYDFDNKYLVELDGRYDGSSNFPVSGRWAFFPSASLGWRVTEEPFMKEVKKIITDLKVRASYGTIGNQDVNTTVGQNLFLPTMTTSQNSWVVGSAKATYTGMPQVVPFSLTWEKINTLDFGADMKFLDNNLGVSFDWFQRDNVGMISSSTTLPATFGASVAKTNVGNMRTNGWEVGVDYHWHLNNGMQLYANASMHDYVTKITKWGGNSSNSLATGYYNGETFGEIWGFQTVGYFKDAADVTNSPSQTKLQSGSFVFGPGDIKYADLNADGKIDGGALTLSDHGDLKKIGNSTPRYQYSFRLGGNWKGFDADVFFQGVGKRDYWATGSVALPGYSGSSIFLQHQMDYWTTSNTDATYPNPYQGNSSSNLSGQQYWAGQAKNTNYGASGNNFYPQTKYLLNLAYLRLKTITVGYTIPASITKKLGVDKFRVYVEGMNLLTFAQEKIPVDPEITDQSTTGNWYGVTTPFTKTYSFGVQLSF
ncbi:TonB-dependent receptor [Paludibacter sp.]|uniref:SusC/RagA family TonB-linked outer membrane protein n=1 Tax=Paludibacter sp. TaxID=1898105 RepID=UPI00135352D0|nr:TonB-dependent receptor [Paludibacter sp.]MTK52001.1 TonB-dependent receptor [Paludibacter sp.]